MFYVIYPVGSDGKPDPSGPIERMVVEHPGSDAEAILYFQHKTPLLPTGWKYKALVMSVTDRPRLIATVKNAPVAPQKPEQAMSGLDVKNDGLWEDEGVDF